MPLADSFMIFGGLLVVGVIGLAVLAVTLLARLVQFVFRLVAGMPADPRPVLHQDGRSVCPHPRCGHTNPEGARYCARCGRPFSRDRDLDAYG